MLLLELSGNARSHSIVVDGNISFAQYHVDRQDDDAFLALRDEREGGGRS